MSSDEQEIIDATQEAQFEAWEAWLDDLEKIEKEWRRYQGPHGGVGWVNPQSGEVRYQEDKPEPGEGGEDEETDDVDEGGDPTGEPEGGFEEGWSEPPDPEEVEEGDVVEVYDSEEDRYLPAIVESTKSPAGSDRLKFSVLSIPGWDPEEHGSEEGETLLDFAGENRYTVTAQAETSAVFPGYEMDSSEVAREVSERLETDAIEDGEQLRGEEKEELKDLLADYYGPDTVDRMYGLQSGASSDTEFHGSWKSSSDGPAAATYERAFKEALGIDAPSRSAANDKDPSDEMVAVAEAMTELSRMYYESAYPNGRVLHRGCARENAIFVMEQYLENPGADEYVGSFLAMNNHTTMRSTAETFDQGLTVEQQIDSEGVVAAHDQLFTKKGQYDTENEITVSGDKNVLPSPNVTLAGRVRADSTPEEWSGAEAEAMAEFLNRNSTDILYGQMDDLSDDHYETIMDMENAVREHRREGETDPSEDDFFLEVRQRMNDEGLSPSDYGGLDNPEGSWEASDFEELDIEPGDGVPVSFYSDILNQSFDGEVVGTTDEGRLLIWDEGGAEQEVPPENLTYVDESAYNRKVEQILRPSPSKLFETSTSVDELNVLDDVYYTFGTETYEGTITDIDDSGLVTINRKNGTTDYLDEDEIAQGYLAPQRVFDDDGE